MRHGKKFNHLGRKTAHRSAMLSNMACSLINHKRIKTTLAKAKALRVYVEPILTKSKEDSTHSRRVVFGYLQDKEIVSELFRDVAPKIADRPGGYTRIIKLGHRAGDSAEMCMIELVDFNELMLAEQAAKKTTRRSRRGGSKTKAEATTTADTKAAEPKEKVEKEVKAESPASEATAPAKEETAAAEEKVTKKEEEVSEPKAENSTDAESAKAEKKEEGENKEADDKDKEDKA